MPISILKPRFAATLALCIAASLSAQQPKSSRWPAVQAQMDASSARFQSAQADLRQEIFTKIPVQDTETRTGQIYFERKGSVTQMGMKLLPPEAKPGTPPLQIVEFKGGKLRSYDAGSNQIDSFPAAGKNQSTAEALMTLGFGGSGTGLAKSFAVTDQGQEQIDGVSVEKLDLVPRDQGIKNNFSHVTIWIDASRDVLLKQIFYLASGGTTTGDTRTVYFTNIRLNQKFDEGLFAIVCKGKCTTVNH
ncbi:MAG TPA: outer membrane lipoprotein-sorting protein [Acidobacteriaceae bacterium]|jgi:outer membrane lipoprotein-sorting protein